MKIIVEIPDDHPRAHLWHIARAVLEEVEPGSGGHCLFSRWGEPDQDGRAEITHYEHHRLGVSIREEAKCTT